MSNLEIIDEWLPQDIYEMLRHHCDHIPFDGVKSPVDGVFYPGVSLDIPTGVLQFFGRPKFIFMRLSLAGVPTPHQAHTDKLMGHRSLMYYVTRMEHVQGGTSLVRHKATGMYRNPTSQLEEDYWKRDTNDPKAWEVYEMAEMLPNRAVMFDADLMHRAEPVGGFGTDSQNGRLVLTAFY